MLNSNDTSMSQSHTEIATICDWLDVKAITSASFSTDMKCFVSTIENVFGWCAIVIFGRLNVLLLTSLISNTAVSVSWILIKFTFWSTVTCWVIGVNVFVMIIYKGMCITWVNANSSFFIASSMPIAFEVRVEALMITSLFERRKEDCGVCVALIRAQCIFAHTS